MLTALLAFSIIQSSAPLDENQRGSYLFRACQGTIRFQDAGVTGTNNDAAKSQFCVAYIGGFLDGLEMANSHAICTRNATMGTIARVYVAYMEKNPKDLDVEMPVGMLNAIMGAYPCPVKKR